MQDDQRVGDPTWIIALITAVGGFGLGLAINQIFSGLPGDPLAFGGALFGAAAAVLGAEIVATRQRRADRRDARAYQYELLTRIQNAIAVITANFQPDPHDATEFNKTLKNIDASIRSLRFDAESIASPDVQKSAGWNVAIQHVTRNVREAEPGFKLFDAEDIRNGHQIALAVAMAQAIGHLTDARLQVESCLIDLKPRFGPPRR